MKPEDKLTPEDQLKAENEILKLKLEMEYGMTHVESSILNTELENSWLNNIYDFEQKFNSAKRIKVYDAIGRPTFRKLSTLSVQEVSVALEEILSVMEKNRVRLERACPYEDTVIYRFITEELFEHEIDDLSGIGMTTYFAYEDFYPNHDFDLRRYSGEFIKNLFTRKWNPEFDTFLLNNTISFKGCEYSIEGISSIILAFLDNRTFDLDSFDIELVSFDLEGGIGTVEARLVYRLHTSDHDQSHDGRCILNFTYDVDRWYISGFEVPGLSG